MDRNRFFYCYLNDIGSVPCPVLSAYLAFSKVKINSVPTPSVLITLMFWL